MEKKIEEKDRAEYEVLKGNALIRDFMKEPLPPIRCEYHSSWDWLMPVVEKINTLFGEKSRELSNHSREQNHLENPLDNPLHWKSWSSHCIHLSTDINYIWEQAIKSIEWYNEKQPSE